VLALTRALKSRQPPEKVRLDSMEITGTALGPGGRELPFRRIGFSLAAGGIGQRFFDKYYAEPVLGARGIARVVMRAVGSHVAGALRLPLPESALAYGRDVFRPTRARVIIDGREVPSLAHGAIHAGHVRTDHFNDGCSANPAVRVEVSILGRTRCSAFEQYFCSRCSPPCWL